MHELAILDIQNVQNMSKHVRNIPRGYSDKWLIYAINRYYKMFKNLPFLSNKIMLLGWVI